MPKIKPAPVVSVGISPPGRGARVPRRAYRVNEFCDAYRVSRDMAYELMRTGQLAFFLIGKERRIPVEAAEALNNPPRAPKLPRSVSAAVNPTP